MSVAAPADMPHRSPVAVTLRRVLVVSGILGVQAMAAVALSQRPIVGIAATAAALAGVLLLVYPGIGLALGLALCFAASRVGPARLDMSISDATLIVSSLAALPHVPWGNAHVRRALSVGALYITMLSLNILIVPHKSSVIELGHRAFLVIGSLIVGSAIANRGRTVLALRCFLAAATGFGVAAVVTTLGDNYMPAYVFGYHKNFVGPLLMMALLVSVAAASTVQLPRYVLNVTRICMSLGLVATQSRAAIIGGGCAFIIWAIRSGRLLRYLPVLTVVLGAATYFVSLTVQRDTADKSNYQFNTVGSRVKVYEIALKLWRDHPIFGYGVRWFRDPAAPTTEPHSSLVATLSETGVWGLVSILLLFGLTMLLLYKRGGALPLAAFAVLAARLVESQLAIFWVAGTMTLPWLLAGLAMATPDPLPTPSSPRADSAVITRQQRVGALS
jgi:polysaccharide biosynthesis protein PslJ